VLLVSAWQLQTTAIRGTGALLFLPSCCTFTRVSVGKVRTNIIIIINIIIINCVKFGCFPGVWKHPKIDTVNTEHGESLKSIIITITFLFSTLLKRRNIISFQNVIMLNLVPRFAKPFHHSHLSTQFIALRCSERLTVYTYLFISSEGEVG
jgi:hypothetical protein